MSELQRFKLVKEQFKKVRNRLPIPTICPNCGAAVVLVNNSVIYGQELGKWPFAYRCITKKCDSYVGIHPKTDIPLGMLANRATRAARRAAKEAFMPMWEQQGIKKTAAYRWLGEKMGIANVDHVHIGWFSIEQCKRVIEICKANSRA